LHERDFTHEAALTLYCREEKLLAFCEKNCNFATQYDWFATAIKRESSETLEQTRCCMSHKAVAKKKPLTAQECKRWEGRRQAEISQKNCQLTISHKVPVDWHRELTTCF
jgi:hypothetical protein